MARKKVLKSLADLAAEAIGAEAVKSEETKLAPQVDTQRSQQIAQPASPSEASTEKGYFHWGLNE